MGLYMPRDKWTAPNVYRTYCHECCSTYDVTCKAQPLGKTKLIKCRSCGFHMVTWQPTDYVRYYKMVKSRQYWESIEPAVEPHPYFKPPARPTIAELRKKWGLPPIETSAILPAFPDKSDKTAPIIESGGTPANAT